MAEDSGGRQSSGCCPMAAFDHNAANHRDGIETVWSQMRASAALPKSEQHGGFFVVTRYDDVSTVTRTHKLYSSAQGIAVPNIHLGAPMLPIESDPPLQGQIRRFLIPHLTRAAAERFALFIRNLAVDLIEAQRGTPAFDFAEAFALPFPSRIALHFLGFPQKDAAMLDNLVNTVVDARGSAEAAAAGPALDTYIETFLNVWREKPLDESNIVSVVAHARLDDRPLTDAEQLSVTRLLLFGGFTTTTFALTSAMRWLAEHPPDWSRLRATPALITTAVDEFVRFASPGTYLGRTVTADTGLAGSTLRAGDRVLVGYGAANRDPARFECPDEIVLERSPNPHMGFGHGTHACIGLHLARLELRIAMEELTRRMAHIALGAKADIRWSSGETQGMTSLPLVVEW